MTEENLKLFRKHSGYEVTDPCHIIACGTPNQLADNVLSENYLAMSFSFEFLKRAEMYYKASDLMNSDITDMIELFLMHDKIFVLKNDDS